MPSATPARPWMRALSTTSARAQDHLLHATSARARMRALSAMLAPRRLAAGLVAALLVGIAPARAQEVVLRTRSDAKAAPISPLLTGAQFSFFNTPIKERSADAHLLNSWKEVPVRVLRYPGGTWAEHYVWDHPEKSYFAVPGASEKTVVSPELFIEMCRKTGAEPIFQVNAIVKGGWSANYTNPTKIEEIREAAKWAAGWVRRANIENGWKVRYWEVGNEVWIMLRPEEYATILTEYSRAMKAVDPSIKIIACGLSSKVGPFKLEWYKMAGDPKWEPRLANVNDPESWNRALFTAAAGAFDYLAPHPYIDNKAIRDPRALYDKTVADVWEQEDMAGQYALLEKYRSPVRLAVTEWATNFSHSVSGHGKYEPNLYFYTLGNGIHTAHYLGQIVAGGKSDLAVMHSLEDTQTLWYWPAKAMSEKPLQHPAFLALRLWGAHLGSRVAPLEQSGVPKRTIGGKAYPAIFAFASEDADNVYLMAINLDPDAPHRIRWRHAGSGTAPQATLSLVSAPSLAADNWGSWNRETAAIDIAKSSLAVGAAGCAFDLPPHSMAGVRLPKRRPARR